MLYRDCLKRFLAEQSTSLICEQPPRILPSYRKVSGLFRVRLIDKLFSSNSQELSLVSVAQLNSDVDERVVIVPWIEAVRERTTAELSVWERTIDLLKHAVAPTVDDPAFFHNLIRSHCKFLNSHFRPAIAFVFSVSFLSFICYQFSSRSFTLVLSSTESLSSSVNRFQGSGFKGSSDKWEVKW